MGKKYQSRKHYSARTSRMLKNAAAVILAVLAVAFVALIVAVVHGALGDLWNTTEMNDDKAMEQLDEYCQRDNIDLNSYLEDRGYMVAGEGEELVYKKGDSTLVIHDMGDSVRIGDGSGNVREYGVPVDYYHFLDTDEVQYDSFICRVGSLDKDAEEKSIASRKVEFRDIIIPRDALAEIVRVTYR